MIKKIATTLAATVGVASAQSWTDRAGFCPQFYEKASDYKFDDAKDVYYPIQEKITLDDPSLNEVVFEFDEGDSKKGVSPVAKCMYFRTQGLPGKDPKQSERYCVDADAKAIGDGLDKKKSYSAGEAIQLWNVKKIETQVVKDKGIVDMTFTMRYTNFSDVVGRDIENDAVLKAEVDKLVEEGKLPESAKTNFDVRSVIYTKFPDADVLTWDAENGWQWVYKIDFAKFLSGDFLPKMFDYAMVKYEDKYRVKFQQAPASDDAEQPAIGCAIDILPGTTIKGAKFNSDFESSDVYLNNLAFRVQPIKEYYDQTHSYSQNGDVYSVGYDNDFYDGKVQYTANGYPPQSFSWKLSRSRSTTVVATALTIAGALVGSWAF